MLSERISVTLKVLARGVAAVAVTGLTAAGVTCIAFVGEGI
jgi:hypothetical protein